MPQKLSEDECTRVDLVAAARTRAADVRQRFAGWERYRISCRGCGSSPRGSADSVVYCVQGMAENVVYCVQGMAENVVYCVQGMAENMVKASDFEPPNRLVRVSKRQENLSAVERLQAMLMRRVAH
ncbi:hypothetical protein FVE85_8546 [Porphyridium purpureum]|uniref:Uncharacterized protein n=1 Tax=Porphyridium purpureum TaxID=35688 RepID=A0A5J4YG64_PORPP|nr:hypothetical protein FVE85_8546 [Porphyridium purpureum]|eukprot:POR7712..scf292_37